MIESLIGLLLFLLVLAAEAVGFSRQISCLYGFALIAIAFTLAQAEFQFDSTVFEIQRKGHERKSAFVHFFAQFFDFGFMGEKTPFAYRIVIVDVAVAVGRDLKSLEPELALTYLCP